MSALYYLLGAVAKLNARMWRYRINLLPLNFLAIGLMIIGGFGTLTDTVEGMHNASTPIDVTVAQIHDSPRLAQDYVTVKGRDIPEALYEYGDKADDGHITRVEKSWSPLLDRESNRVLLVQRPGKLSGGADHEASITGMLRELSTDLRSSLAAQHDTISGVPVETRYMLVADAKPASPIVSAVFTGLLFAAAALFLFVSIMRNTIFQRMSLGTPLTKVRSEPPIKVGTTGTFTLKQPGKTVEKRFVDMPSILAHNDDGNPALFSNIDASSKFFGVTTTKMSGIWTVAIDAGSVRDAQVGFLYWGLKRLPALRFAYSESGRLNRQAIITAESLQVLDSAVSLLTTAPVAAPPSQPRTSPGVGQVK
ncbi:MAG TPA: hypothetical protein VJN70_02940 [Gemmatimonadaceae bacterium]|nr:hypothetical protein [Gemmatimonadaceae bacterium]